MSENGPHFHFEASPAERQERITLKEYLQDIETQLGHLYREQSSIAGDIRANGLVRQTEPYKQLLSLTEQKRMQEVAAGIADQAGQDAWYVIQIALELLRGALLEVADMRVGDAADTLGLLGRYFIESIQPPKAAGAVIVENELLLLPGDAGNAVAPLDSFMTRLRIVRSMGGVERLAGLCNEFKEKVTRGEVLLSYRDYLQRFNPSALENFDPPTELVEQFNSLVTQLRSVFLDDASYSQGVLTSLACIKLKLAYNEFKEFMGDKRHASRMWGDRVGLRKGTVPGLASWNSHVTESLAPLTEFLQQFIQTVDNEGWSVEELRVDLVHAMTVFGGISAGLTLLQNHMDTEARFIWRALVNGEGVWTLEGCLAHEQCPPEKVEAMRRVFPEKFKAFNNVVLVMKQKMQVLADEVDKTATVNGDIVSEIEALHTQLFGILKA